MPDRMRCAVVGIGHRAGTWIDGIVNLHADRAELVALCDPVEQRCRDANARFKTDAAIYDDYDRMLAEVKPDAVIVVSPDGLHAQQTVKALDAGCRVACEKPLCTTGEDAQAVLDAEERNGQNVCVCLNYRHVPLVSRVRQLIVEGAIGKPLSVDLSWYLDYHGHGASYFRRWHRQMANSGGLLITKATHHFDIVNWYMGAAPATVYAQCARNLFGAGKSPFKGTRCRDCQHADECSFFYESDPEKRSAMLGFKVTEVHDYEGDLCVFADEIDVYDTMALTVKYANGAMLSYSLNCAVPFEGWQLAINGTKGRLETGITDGKPEPGWQNRFKLVKEGLAVKDPDLQVTHWPADYTIHMLPHGAPAYQVAVPHVAEGHGGGDPAIMRSFFVGREGEQDPLGLFAPAIQGAWCMAVGAAANVSAAEDRVVQISEVLGRWAG